MFPTNDASAKHVVISKSRKLMLKEFFNKCCMKGLTQGFKYKSILIHIGFCGTRDNIDLIHSADIVVVTIKIASSNGTINHRPIPIPILNLGLKYWPKSIHIDISNWIMRYTQNLHQLFDIS